jgi:AcrR family transcriptional regulator
MTRAKTPPRRYGSATRTRQAAETRTRIVESARALLEVHGFDGTTIDAVARVAGVSPQTVYSIFGSKRGIIAELLDRARFGADYQGLVADARATPDPRVRLGFAARISRQIYDAERATFELLRGAGAVAPELAVLQREHEDQRREVQAPLVRELAEAQELRSGLDVDAARDLLWMLTSRDIYRLLVIEREWSATRYEAWLGDAISRELLAPIGGPPPTAPRRAAARAEHGRRTTRKRT